ncbi:MAG: type II secretion system protein GspM [bacterium]
MTPLNSLRTVWEARNQREKLLLALMAVLLAFLLGWLVFINPALHGRAYWHHQLVVMQDDLSHMRYLMAEINQLPVRAKASLSAVSRQQLESNLRDKGLQADTLEIADYHVNARFIDISFASFTELLHQWQTTSQLVVEDITVTARDRIDRIDAHVILKQAQ